MKLIKAFSLLLVAVLYTTSCTHAQKETNKPMSSASDSLSYSLGVLIGKNLKSQGFTDDLSPEQFLQAIKDVIADAELKIQPQDANKFVSEFSQTAKDRAATKNLEEGQFPGMTVSPIGYFVNCATLLTTYLLLGTAMTLQIKPFKSISSRELFELVRKVYESTDSMSELFEEKYPSRGEFERELERASSQPDMIAVCAIADDLLAGYLTIQPRRAARLRHTADLNMGVEPHARGKGIGRALLEHSLEIARSSTNLEIVYLMVRADNAAAVSLYEKCGFERVVLLERDTKIKDKYYDGLLMRIFMQQRPSP